MTPEGHWESTARLEASSEWFSGHFDEFPLLPGIALLALAAEVLKKQGREQGRDVDVFGFSKVRFKRLAFPGEELYISVAGIPSEVEAELDFRITCRGETVAQGFIKAREILRDADKDI